jgi:hypothetical protein
VERFFASGAAVDFALGVLAVNILALTLLARPEVRRRRAIDLALLAAPGACLMLALRAALTEGGWMAVAFWLAASFPLHIADLLRRRV